MTPEKLKIKPILGPKMDPKMDQDGWTGARENPAGAILKALVSKIALKMAQDGPE